MLKMGIWPYSCGTPDAFLTPACNGGRAPVAPSALSAGTRTSLRDENGQAIRVETSMPRALELEEIPSIVNDFRQAIANAREAGFDLVELHSAHGYLLHQFLSPSSNHRTDQYGGSVENRARLVLEVVDAGIEEWGADRIGIRVSPIGTFQNTDNGPNEEADALYLIEQLGKRGIAYLHMSEPDWAGVNRILMRSAKKYAPVSTVRLSAQVHTQ